MMLSIKNAHARDANISFEEGPHIYTITNSQGIAERGTYTSCTTFIHHLFRGFITDDAIDSIMRNRKYDTDPSYKYYKLTREEIVKKWDENRDEAAKNGTNMHYNIECYYNGLDVKDDSLEFKYFLRFAEDYKHLKPYRTEWMVYYEELKICGSIDMVFENEDGDLEIYDWKRCKEFQYEAYRGKTSHIPCISHLPDTNFWHYSLQLNIYRRILQDKYGKKVVKLCLVRMHPDDPYKTYDRAEVQIMDEEIDDLMKYRMKNIELENEMQH